MIKVTLLSYNIVTTFENTNYNMHTVRKTNNKKTNCEKILWSKIYQKKKKNKLMVGFFFFWGGKILSFLMVGYKILSFLDVVEILITTTSKANEVANIHKK